MAEYTTKIRQIAQELLESGKVEAVIGFRKGTMPMSCEPAIIRDPGNVDQLVWNSNCRINLANYLTGRKEKIGIIAKGCDSRNIVNHIVENKIKRDQLVIIGIPCTGMVDRLKISEHAQGEITGFEENGTDIMITGRSFEKTLKKNDILQDNCSLCVHRNPVIYDELAGDPVEEQVLNDRFEDVTETEKMSADEKYDFFGNLIEGCTRCYACRNACPLCYCPTCFVDESKPQWVGKGQDPIDVRTYHLLRAFHCAGRCTDCGACENACPQNIKIRQFNRKLEKDCFELYGWEAGLDIDQRPPLDTFNVDDPDAFIK